MKSAELEPGLFRGKKMTAEEGIVMKKNNVPCLLEDKLKELDAEYHSSTIPFTGHVECDVIWTESDVCRTDGGSVGGQV
jgi:hypothetical protein